MGCRNRGFSDEEENNVLSASLNDALLFTTMCIIGLPVDVHAKDGSIISGIFYTACVDDDYSIVLKKARMIKKGSQDVNVANGSLIETLIIHSEDLVQVVAKGVQLPANGSFGNSDGDDVGAIAAQFPDSEAKATKRQKSNIDRSIYHVENGFPHDLTTKAASYFGGLGDENGNSDGRDFAEGEEDSAVLANGRQEGDGSGVKPNGCEEKLQSLGDQTADVLQGSSSDGDAGENPMSAVENVLTQATFNGVPSEMSSDGLAKPDDQGHEKVKMEDTQQSNAVSSGVFADAMPTADIALESSVSSSLASTESVAPKNSNHKIPAKESKLNPGAKIFSPSPLHQRSAISPPIPTVPGVTYIREPSPGIPVAVSQPEFEINLFSQSAMPAKFVPHDNLLVGNGINEPQYVYPFVGHSGNRIQPVRYAGQYNHLQAGPAFMHPNSQNVMVGRIGPVVYLHPLACDVHSAAGFSQVSTCPLLAPHQVHLPKHQGSPAQALQLYMTPPLIAGGQQPFVMPSHSPVSPPPFPVIQPTTVPAPNGFFSAKLA